MDTTTVSELGSLPLELLKSRHEFWGGVSRAAKNEAQRQRADRRCAEVTFEIRRRHAVRS